MESVFAGLSALELALVGVGVGVAVALAVGVGVWVADAVGVGGGVGEAGSGLAPATGEARGRRGARQSDVGGAIVHPILDATHGGASATSAHAGDSAHRGSRSAEQGADLVCGGVGGRGSTGRASERVVSLLELG